MRKVSILTEKPTNFALTRGMCMYGIWASSVAKWLAEQLCSQAGRILNDFADGAESKNAYVVVRSPEDVCPSGLNGSMIGRISRQNSGILVAQILNLSMQHRNL